MHYIILYIIHRLKNITELQHSLSKITLNRESNLDHAKQYYELLYLNSDVSCIAIYTATITCDFKLKRKLSVKYSIKFVCLNFGVLNFTVLYSKLAIRVLIVENSNDNVCVHLQEMLHLIVEQGGFFSQHEYANALKLIAQSQRNFDYDGLQKRLEILAQYFSVDNV